MKKIALFLEVSGKLFFNADTRRLSRLEYLRLSALPASPTSRHLRLSAFKRLFQNALLIPCIFVSFLGCAPLIIGGAVGALGGYVVSRDTIQGETDKSYNILWNAALIVSKIRGNIKYENKTKGYLELEAESSRVYIRLVRLTLATTRLRVSARKYHFPNMDLAQDIFVKIMEQAR